MKPLKDWRTKWQAIWKEWNMFNLNADAMRGIILLTLVTAFLNISKAQDCNTLVRAEFNEIHDRLTLATSDRDLMDRAIPLLRRNCLTTHQVKRIAVLFETDKLRLVFAKRAYRNVLNPEDYYEVMDAFNRFSFAFYLYDFINYQEEDYYEGPDEVVVIVEEPPLEICETFADEYNGLIATLKKEVFPMRRLGLAKSLVQNRCLNVNQIKGVINLLSIGGDRVELAKVAYENCPNQMDYHQLIDLMTFQTDKDELLRFIQSKQ